MKKKLMMVMMVVVFSFMGLRAQDMEYVPGKKNFTDYYFSPLKINRDHPLHTSFFHIPLLSARSLESDTLIMGSSFEYTSIDSDYQNDTFSYDFEGGLYRLNFDMLISAREDLDFLVRYDVSGVDGDNFSVFDGNNILRTDLKKTGSGNLDVIAKQKIYTFKDYGIDLGLVIGCSIPIVQTKTLAVSRRFDFGGGILATYQRELFAVHFNMGFVYMDQSTAFTDEADVNYSVYGGVSVVGKIVNKWYAILQGSIQNPAFKSEFSPSNVVGDLNLGVRYVYNAYITELWVGQGVGNASHGLNVGFSFSMSF